MPPETTIQDQQKLLEIGKALKDSLKETNTQIKENEEAFKKGTIAIGEYKKAKEGLDERTKKLNERLIETQNNMDATTLATFRAKQMIDEANRRSSDFRNSMSGLAASAKVFGAGGAEIVDKLSKMGRAFVGTGAVAMAFSNNITRGLINPLSSAEDIVKSLPAPLRNVNEVLKAQRQIFDLTSTAMVGFGESFERGQTTGRDFMSVMREVSARTGFSRSEMMKFGQSLKDVPSFFKSIGDVAKDTGGYMRELDASMRALRAIGITNMAEGGKLLGKIYSQFGVEYGPAARKEIARLSAAAHETGVSVNFARAQIMRATEPLTIFRGSASDATGVWKTFMGVLRDDIPIEKVGKLVSQVTGGIANMNLQTRAFVAQMSGMVHGVTALGGALRMELDMRTAGGMERNLQRATEALSRVSGGRIVTLEEAAQAPGMEMQFQLQRQMVGQMFGVKGEQEAARVLEVLQQVQKGGISTVDANKAMGRLMRDGKDLQRASLTAMESLFNQAQTQTGLLEGIKSAEDELIRYISKYSAEVIGLPKRRGGRLPREARIAGAGIRRGFAEAGKKFEKAMENFYNTIDKVGRELATGITGRPSEEEVRARASMRPIIKPGAPEETFRAERLPRTTEERIMAITNPQGTARGTRTFGEGLTESLRSTMSAMRERTDPQGIFPVPPTRPETIFGTERISPTLTTTPGVPPIPGVGAGTQPAGIASIIGGEQEPKVPSSITVGVVCENCRHKVAEEIIDLKTQINRNTLGDNRPGAR
jgi:hypothetical protein